MKNVFLTLAVVAAMVLGMSKVVDAAPKKYTCALYINEYCNFTALVCGETEEEMHLMALLWNEMLGCNMGALAD